MHHPENPWDPGEEGAWSGGKEEMEKEQGNGAEGENPNQIKNQTGSWAIAASYGVGVVNMVTDGGSKNQGTDLRELAEVCRQIKRKKKWAEVKSAVLAHACPSDDPA